VGWQAESSEMSDVTPAAPAWQAAKGAPGLGGLVASPTRSETRAPKAFGAPVRLGDHRLAGIDARHLGARNTHDRPTSLIPRSP